MKKVNFTKAVMQVITTLPEDIREMLADVNLEIKEYPDDKSESTQVVINQSAKMGDLFRKGKHLKQRVVLYKWPMVSVSSNLEELKTNIRMAILSQTDKAIGLSLSELIQLDEETTSHEYH